MFQIADLLAIVAGAIAGAIAFLPFVFTLKPVLDDRQNADMLKMGTIETAREAERSVVDIQTLQHTNEQLISTLDEVMNIQREGAQKRREAEAELGRIEGQLKQKLLELQN